MHIAHAASRRAFVTAACRVALAALTATLMAALPAALPTASQAQGTRSFAVVSEMARDVNVIIYQPAIGSRLTNNVVSRIPIAQGMLDKFVLNNTRAALAKEAPGERVFLVSPLDSDLFGSLQSVTEGSSIKIPADVADAFKSQGSTHLVVFSRHRTEGLVQFDNGRESAGSLEGLGFYVDRLTNVTNRSQGQSGRGYIAPYLHARATLVELPSGKVLRTVEIQEASPYTNTRADAQSNDAWDSLSSSDKVRVLLELMDRHIAKSVKALLAPA
jgi:hypothetical protein